MTDASHETREIRDLIAAARQDDAEARDELVRRLYPKVQRIVHQRLNSSIRRDNPWVRSLFSTGDVVHDVFIGMLASASDIADQGEEAVVRYLAVSIQNRLLDMMRHHRAMRRDVRRRAGTSEGGANPDLVPADGAGIPGDSSAADKVSAYQEVLLTLSTKYQAVLRLRLEQGQPFAKIAEVVGLPTADAARKLFHYAHAKLLALLTARGVRPEDLGGGR